MISIIVPVYNTEKYLEECLDSICRQTYRDIEILLINDSSTDGSLAICESYAAGDSRISVYSKPNSGPSDTRNYGLDRAKGEYVMFFDSDDYAEPGLCEKLLSAMEADGTDLAMCGNYNVATARTSRRRLFDGNKAFFGDEYRDEILVPTLGPVGKRLRNPDKLDKLTPIWARLYRRDIIADNSIRFIDLKKIPSECVLFNLEYSLRAGSASYVDEALYYYRRNTGISQTKPYREGLWEKWSNWTVYMKSLLESQGSPDDLFEAYRSRLCCAVIPLGGNAMKKPTRRERLAEMRYFLGQDALREAFDGFDCGSSPFYWRLFFYSAKKRRARLFYILTWSMRKILSLRKK